MSGESGAPPDSRILENEYFVVVDNIFGVAAGCA
jgi:hypothetical protein